MRRFAISIALCLAVPLAACGQMGTRPASIGRQSAASADAAYIAASAAGQELVKLGALDKDRYKVLDNQAYNALMIVRSAAKAYAAGVGTKDAVQAALIILTAADAALQNGGK